MPSKTVQASTVHTSQFLLIKKVIAINHGWTPLMYDGQRVKGKEKKILFFAELYITQN